MNVSALIHHLYEETQNAASTVQTNTSRLMGPAQLRHNPAQSRLTLAHPRLVAALGYLYCTQLSNRSRFWARHVH
jgi:hypothetical protein